MNDIQTVTQNVRLQQWTAIIQDRQASGLKVDDYCSEHNITCSTSLTMRVVYHSSEYRESKWFCPFRWHRLWLPFLLHEVQSLHSAKGPYQTPSDNR